MKSLALGGQGPRNVERAASRNHAIGGVAYRVEERM